MSYFLSIIFLSCVWVIPGAAQDETRYVDLLIRFLRVGSGITPTDLYARPLTTLPLRMSYRFGKKTLPSKPIRLLSSCSPENDPCYYRAPAGTKVEIFSASHYAIGFRWGIINNGLQEIHLKQRNKPSLLGAQAQDILKCNNLDCFDTVIKPAPNSTFTTEPCGSPPQNSDKAEQYDIYCSAQIPSQVDFESRPLFELIVFYQTGAAPAGK